MSVSFFAFSSFLAVSMTSFAIWQDEMKEKYAEAVKRGKG